MHIGRLQSAMVDVTFWRDWASFPFVMLRLFRPNMTMAAGFEIEGWEEDSGFKRLLENIRIDLPFTACL